ncbi:MAG: 6-phosphogluconolactonase [Rhizomicrobium sp.]
MEFSSIAGEINIASDIHALSQKAAEWFVQAANAKAGDVRVALAGGSTPKEFYRLIGSDVFRSRIPWQRLEFFWGDERCVPHDNADSNFRMATDTLLSRVPISQDRIHPMPVDGAPDDCARRYQRELKNCYGSDVFDPARPLFDIMLLGLGSDGHTCSLLPGQPVLDERKRWVAPVPSGRDEPRITLTYPAIESSRLLVFLVCGADKSGALTSVRAGDTSFPAARIATRGEIIWFVDAAAAAEPVSN